jgi:hypothetical protein
LVGTSIWTSCDLFARWLLSRMSRPASLNPAVFVLDSRCPHHKPKSPRPKLSRRWGLAALDRHSAVLTGTAFAWRPTPDLSKGSRLPRIAPQRNYGVPPRPRIAPQCYIVATQRPESRLSATILPLSGPFPSLSALRGDMGFPRGEDEGQRGRLGQEKRALVPPSPAAGPWSQMIGAGNGVRCRTIPFGTRSDIVTVTAQA